MSESFYIWRFDSCLLKEKNCGSVSLTSHLVNSNCFTFDTLKAASLTKKENQGGGGRVRRNEHSSLYLLCSKVFRCVVDLLKCISVIF